MIDKLLDSISYILKELLQEEITIISYETTKGEKYFISLDSETTLYITPYEDKIYSICRYYQGDKFTFYYRSIKEVVSYINSEIV